MKLCTTCGEEKPLTQFGRRRGKPRHRCKQCVRERNTPAKKRFRRYGITQAQYEGLMNSQKGRCLICSRKSSLVIDHCHVTKKVRGLLCSECNVAIGLLCDSPRLVRRALDYLNSKLKRE